MNTFAFATKEEYQNKLLSLVSLMEKSSQKKHDKLEQEYEKLADEYVKFCEQEED